MCATSRYLLPPMSKTTRLSATKSTFAPTIAFTSAGTLHAALATPSYEARSGPSAGGGRSQNSRSVRLAITCIASCSISGNIRQASCPMPCDIPSMARKSEGTGQMNRIGGWIARGLAAAGLALSLSACGINTVPRQDEQVKAAWSQVQNEYQRRADLVPNLVATVKGYAAQEKTVLTQVVEARAKATQTTVNLPPDVTSNPQAFHQFEQSQNQ